MKQNIIQLIIKYQIFNSEFVSILNFLKTWGETKLKAGKLEKVRWHKRNYNFVCIIFSSSFITNDLA